MSEIPGLVMETRTVDSDGTLKASYLIGRYGIVTSEIDGSHSDKIFPIEKHNRESKDIVIVSLNKKDGALNFEDVLARLAQFGLEQPTYEDALLFGTQHDDVQMKHRIIFPHKPVLDKNGKPSVLILDTYMWRTTIGLYELPFQVPEYFAGVRKRVLQKS